MTNEEMIQQSFTPEEIAWVEKWGQTDDEVADVLDEPGYPEEDPAGFADLARGSDYLWLELFERWVRRSNSFFEKDDETILFSIREKLNEKW